MLDATGAVEYCSEVHLEADSWMTIHGCLADGTYNGILMDYIEKTSSYLDDIGLHGTNLTEIPIIIIDGVKLEDLTTLQTTLCKKYVSIHIGFEKFNEIYNFLKLFSRTNIILQITAIMIQQAK